MTLRQWSGLLTDIIIVDGGDCHVTWQDHVTRWRSGETAQSFPHRGRHRRSLVCVHHEVSLFTSHNELDLGHGRVDGVEHVAAIRQRQFCVATHTHSKTLRCSIASEMDGY